MFTPVPICWLFIFMWCICVQIYVLPNFSKFSFLMVYKEILYFPLALSVFTVFERNQPPELKVLVGAAVIVEGSIHRKLRSRYFMISSYCGSPRSE